MRKKFSKFMYGRYGNDELNQFLFVLVIASLVISLISKNIRYISNLFYYISICLAGSVYFRIFSKNINKRNKEKVSYLKHREKINLYLNRKKH